jgi:hypothetical protein
MFAFALILASIEQGIDRLSGGSSPMAPGLDDPKALVQKSWERGHRKPVPNKE